MWSGMMNHPTNHGNTFSRESERANKQGRCRHICGDDQQEQGHASVTNSDKHSYPSTTYHEQSFNERGSKVRIHDEERVFAAMTNGTARIVQCVGCSRHLLATRDIELVYCPVCHTITPMEIGGLLPHASSSCCENVARRQQQGN